MGNLENLKRLPRREPLLRTLLRGAGGGIFLLGIPVLVWVFALGIGSEGGLEWNRVPRSLMMTALLVGFYGVLIRDFLRIQGLLPLMRWRRVGDSWHLRFANELLGWRTVATVRSGDTIELVQRDNTPGWAGAVGVRSGSPYRRCAVKLSAPGVETEVHVSLPLHRQYVARVQQAMKADGLDVTFTFRSSVRPVSPFDSAGGE